MIRLDMNKKILCTVATYLGSHGIFMCGVPGAPRNPEVKYEVTKKFYKHCPKIWHC